MQAIGTRSGKILNEPISIGNKYEQVVEKIRIEDAESEQVDDLEEAKPIAKTV